MYGVMWRGRERCTGVCVPFVLVVRALLFADELLVHDFFELDHCGGGVCGFTEDLTGVRVMGGRLGRCACGGDAVAPGDDGEL